MYSKALLFVSILPLTQAVETILGVYIFSRHGDRTSKSIPPAALTDLGYHQVFASGSYFRDRYISSTAKSRILGIESDIVKLSQISVSSPVDNVLQNSAQGFLQGLYPAVGSTLSSELLRNGTTVHAPLDGYQLIPVQTISAGTASEDSAWLQGASNCTNAIASSNDYFLSQDYTDLLSSTRDFYKSLNPMLNGTLSDDQISYKNAYTIYDLLNVASIHNTTTALSPTLLTIPTLTHARLLADHHEFSLAYNTTTPIRAIAGSTLAAQILQSLNTTLVSHGKGKVTIQFGAYASFLSFFALAQLPSQNQDFYGVPDYASTMAFELFTNNAGQRWPAEADVQVRFLFRNGTASGAGELVGYPLFGGTKNESSWRDFVDGMRGFAIEDQKDWCKACGNSTGVCSSAAGGTAAVGGMGSDGQGSSEARGGGMSNVVAGVVGAMVTLAVILGLEALIVLLGGWRLVSKKRLAARTDAGSDMKA